MFQSSIVKFTFWVFFVIIFYNLLIKLAIFAGLDEFVSKMYIFWFSVILFFISVLIPNKIDLNS